MSGQPVGAGLAETVERLAARAPAVADPVEREPFSADRRPWFELVPSRFSSARIEDWSEEVGSCLSAWATSPHPVNLVIFGEATGVGKTHAAIGAARPLWERGLDLCFIPEGEMFAELRASIDTHDRSFMADLLDVEVLVVDDLGAARTTDWQAEQLYNVINRRWMEEVRTVITSNLTPAQLEESIGARTFSRLVGSDAVLVRISGTDRRRRRVV